MLLAVKRMLMKKRKQKSWKYMTFKNDKDNWKSVREYM